MKERGDKATYGSAGVGSANHLSCILLDMAIGTKTTHVPYRSGGLAMQDLVGGQIDFNCNVVSSALPQMNGSWSTPSPCCRARASPCCRTCRPRTSRG